MKKGNKKTWKFCGKHYIKIVDITRKTCERNGIVLSLNEKHKYEGLDHKFARNYSKK